MGSKRQAFGEIVWYSAIFLFMYIWFSRIHPLIVFDADDWTYLAYVRSALPIWGEWNPAKVFPEVIMPLVSSIGYHLFFPITKDYLGTFTIVHAAVVSAFITVYVWCFAQMIRRIFATSHLTTVLLSGLFLIFHFLVFRGTEEGNLYMFHCVDLNCYYNYLIPALIGASMVMYMINNAQFEQFLKQGTAQWQGIACLAVYFAVFSNLTTSGILAAYAGSKLLLDLIRQGKSFRLKEYIRENTVYLLILAAWFISAVFELSGGRAVSATENLSLLQQLRYAAYCLKVVIFSCHPAFLATVGSIVVLTVCFFVCAKGKGSAAETLVRNFLPLIVAGAAMLVYTIALCAVVDPEYMFRSEYLFGIFFFGFLIVLLAAAYIVTCKPRILLTVPLVLAVLLSLINTNGRTFHESNKFNVHPKICAAISQDILQQILDADQAGESEMVLYVPYNVADPENDDNWPHTLVLMPRVSGALYEHGMTKSHIGIVDVIASEEMNQRFGLPMPTD